MAETCEEIYFIELLHKKEHIDAYGESFPKCEKSSRETIYSCVKVPWRIVGTYDTIRWHNYRYGSPKELGVIRPSYDDKFAERYIRSPEKKFDIINGLLHRLLSVKKELEDVRYEMKSLENAWDDFLYDYNGNYLPKIYEEKEIELHGEHCDLVENINKIVPLMKVKNSTWLRRRHLLTARHE